MRIAEIRAQGQVQQAQVSAQQVQTITQPTGQPRYYIETPSGRIPQYAKGAFVTRPTLAEIGEGGEPEYVVPQSKAMSFANNIVAGRRGEAALGPDPWGTERTRATIAAASAARGGLREIEKNMLLRTLGWQITPWGGAVFKGTRPSQVVNRPEVPVRTSGASQMAMTTPSPARRPSGPSGPIAINIQTGPVVEMNGQRYVSYDDLERAMRVTADGVIGRLRTPYARQALGR